MHRVPAVGLAAFGDCGDLGRQPQGDHDQRLSAIGPDDQEIVGLKPVAQATESDASAFDLDAAIDAEQRDRLKRIHRVARDEAEQSLRAMLGPNKKTGP